MPTKKPSRPKKPLCQQWPSDRLCNKPAAWQLGSRGYACATCFARAVSAAIRRCTMAERHLEALGRCRRV